MNMLTKAAGQGAACGLVIGLVLLIGWHGWHPATGAAPSPAVADVVRARSFDVVDAAGKEWASLGLVGGTPGLTLFDAAGQVRANLHLLTGEGYASLSLCDGTGRRRVDLTVFSDGTPWVGLMDAAGKMRASLETSRDGDPNLTVYDAAGHERAALGTTTLLMTATGEERKRAESSLVLFDKDGKVMWQAP